MMDNVDPPVIYFSSLSILVRSHHIEESSFMESYNFFSARRGSKLTCVKLSVTSWLEVRYQYPPPLCSLILQQ